ncbi:MAG: tail fiber domain-containing protein [Opitutaceae bacterium]|nr:tail fiber domain-containing protein [Opitutaceae bacterium]
MAAINASGSVTLSGTSFFRSPTTSNTPGTFNFYLAASGIREGTAGDVNIDTYNGGWGSRLAISQAGAVTIPGTFAVSGSAAATSTLSVGTTSLNNSAFAVNGTGKTYFATFSDFTTTTLTIAGSGGVITLTPTTSISVAGTLGVTGTTNILGSSGAALSSTALNVFGATGNGVIYTRHTGTSAGKYWSTGADGGNNFVVFNQGAVGMYMTDGGTSWTAFSDERMKDIIEPITGALANIAQLRSVIGKYKTDAEGVRRPFLIAQDVQKVMPEAVIERDGVLGMSYTDVIPLLVAAIKELSADFQAYKSTHP